MQAFLASVVAIVAISVAANFTLNSLDFSSSSVYQTTDVRLD